MVANSEHSTKNVNKRTGKTSTLTAVQALEILQQSIINCQQAGIEVQLASIGETNTGLVMVGVRLVDNDLVMA
mgnify:CR=1 FL=1